MFSVSRLSVGSAALDLIGRPACVAPQSVQERGYACRAEGVCGVVHLAEDHHVVAARILLALTRQSATA